MFEFPDFLSPVALSFIGFDIRWYSLSYILGFIYFYWFAKKNKDSFNLNIKQIDNLFFYGFIGIIIGGRIGYFLFYNFSYLLKYPLDLLKIWEGGMSFHGALIGCIFAIFYFTHKYNFSLYKISDLLTFLVE